MKKNNFWNRLFFSSKIRDNKREMSLYTKQCNEGQRVIDALNKSNNLSTLMNIHKDAWETGFQNENIGPCPYGIFRTSDIPTMTPDEVYLGGIWGLLTKPIPFWEEHKDEPYGCNGFGIDKNNSLYAMIVNQYKSLLLSNIKVIYHNAQKEYNIFKQYGY